MIYFARESKDSEECNVSGSNNQPLEFRINAGGQNQEMELTVLKESSNAVFTDRFEEEVTRVVQFLQAEQIKHEMMAKALLQDFLLQSKVLDEPVAIMADKLAASFKGVEQQAASATTCLGKIALEADKSIGTSCFGLLERRLGDADVSTAFFVVLSDIYEAGRLAHKERGDGNSKWEAPATFERETRKYWYVCSLVKDSTTVYTSRKDSHSNRFNCSSTGLRVAR